MVLSLANPARWPSLTHEQALAAKLFGDKASALVTEWLGDEVARVGDVDRLNAASRATAARAGRPSILDSVFLRL